MPTRKQEPVEDEQIINDDSKNAIEKALGKSVTLEPATDTIPVDAPSGDETEVVAEEAKVEGISKD